MSLGSGLGSVGMGGDLKASVQGQLFQDGVHVTLHRVKGDVQPLSNLLIAEPFPYQGNHLLLAPSHLHCVSHNRLISS